MGRSGVRLNTLVHNMNCHVPVVFAGDGADGDGADGDARLERKLSVHGCCNIPLN